MNEYKKGNWATFCIHNEKETRGFFGEFRFLSNFEPCDIFSYPSVENAYMAAKLVKEDRAIFKTCSAREAKRDWKNYRLIDADSAAWDARKYDVMVALVFEKFRGNKALRGKLLLTGDKYLEELNLWKDSYWGVDLKIGGQNNLGKILMKTRAFWGP